MRNAAIRSLLVVWALAAASSLAAAQGPATREALIEQQQAAKASSLEPYTPNAGEKWAQRAEDILTNGGKTWHPYFSSAYSGGGFAFGAGYMTHVSPFNYVDLRGSYTIAGYKRIEAEYVAPRLFKRRGHLSVLGGWREATQVAFYGLGLGTDKADRTNYDFEQPYALATLTLWPTRDLYMIRGSLEWSQWKQQPGQDGAPSVETRYTSDVLPGLGATVDYLHTQATVGIDTRTSAGYSRRGTFLGVTAHDFTDNDERFGFHRIDYEAIQHIPILREAWVISLRALATTTHDKSGQAIPFFMLPSLGGGSNLRGYSSWRFRDRNSLLLQGEWRIMVNRFFDTAFFYDAGTVAPRPSDLTLDVLRHDFGFGVRFHGPFNTPFRVDVARSDESTAIVFASSAVF
jgi:hypothetical protein